MKNILLAVLISFCSISQAAFIDLIPPADADGDNGSGSTGSPLGFGSQNGSPGVIFNALQDLSITAVSVAMAFEGSVQVSASILDSSGSFLVSNTQVVSNSDDRFRPTDRINPSSSADWFWYDIPLDFTFSAGNQYQLVFPFHEYFTVSGTYTFNPNNWLMAVRHFYDSEFRAGTEPYSPSNVLEVVAGTRRGSVPLVGMVSSSTNLPEIDRTYGYSESNPVNVSEPRTILLLLTGLCVVIFRRSILERPCRVAHVL